MEQTGCLALEIDPRYAQSYYNRGLDYYYREEYDKAWDDVEKEQNLGYNVQTEFLKDLLESLGKEK